MHFSYYGCVRNYCNIGIKQPFMFADSLGQESGEGTASRASFCSVLSGASTLESPKAHSLTNLVVGTGWRLEAGG